MPTRRKPEERRQEIVAAALRLADPVGLDRITSRDVAAELDVAPGLVHHYFATMDELIAAAFAEFTAAEHTRLRRTVDPLPPLPALCAYVAYHLAGDQTSARIWMGAWAAAPRRPKLAVEVDNRMIAGLQYLRELLERGHAAEAFTVPDPELSAYRILVLLDGLLVQAYMRPGKRYGDVDSLAWDTVEREVSLPAGTLRGRAAD
ncbi:TetR/AcrR family transcriptional regulator [Amycolatopsis jejuensis]|uniref:TetR/AcrR family transcriptional regulator n=1 Tax=Amycolatopsis jejuensis TaxID=330084 RepID=UPI000524278E|nr:TetR family transcriptional regulator C-terminal domain-containing protein [Amycolatopsis jejuensis]